MHQTLNSRNGITESSVQDLTLRGEPQNCAVRAETRLSVTCTRW